MTYSRRSRRFPAVFLPLHDLQPLIPHRLHWIFFSPSCQCGLGHQSTLALTPVQTLYSTCNQVDCGSQTHPSLDSNMKLLPYCIWLCQDDWYTAIAIELGSFCYHNSSSRLFFTAPGGRGVPEECQIRILPWSLVVCHSADRIHSFISQHAITSSPMSPSWTTPTSPPLPLIQLQ